MSPWLWMMLAPTPVAPPPAVPQGDPVVVAPAPAPAPQQPDVAPPREAAPVANSATTVPQTDAEPSEDPKPVVATEPSESSSPTDGPSSEQPSIEDVFDSEPAEAPHTVTLIHRGAASSSAHVESSPPQSEDSFQEFFVSGYGGLITRGSAVSGKMGLLRGFHGGLLLGDRISIGLAYHRLKRRFGASIVDPQGRPLALEMAYGGLEVGATVVRRGRFELGVQTLFGGGAACVTYDTNRRSRIAECVESVRMMVVEPSALANILITDWMRFGVEAGYRGVARTAWRAPNDFDLGGGFFGLNLDFGWFARPS